MMMYTLLYMTLLTTGTSAEERGTCEGAKDEDAHTKTDCESNAVANGGKHTPANWKPTPKGPKLVVTKDTKPEDIKTKEDFIKYMDAKIWCSAEAVDNIGYEWRGNSGWDKKWLPWNDGTYSSKNEGLRQYMNAMLTPPEIGADGWREEYEYQAVGAQSRSMRVARLLKEWNKDKGKSPPEGQDQKIIDDTYEKMGKAEYIETLIAYCFTSKAKIASATSETFDNDAPVGVAILGGIGLYALYWIPSLWYPAFLTLLGGATALYSSTNMIQMASRIQNQETELITTEEYAETIGLAGCLGCSILVWICTQLSRTGFNFFGIPKWLG